MVRSAVAQQQLEVPPAPAPGSQADGRANGAPSGPPDGKPARAARRPGAARESYTAQDIQILEGIQAIRHRPGMYIGSTSTSGL
jgi:hypothetical protein